MDMGFLKIGALSPQVHIAEPAKNMELAVKAVKSAAENGAQAVVLPELYLSAYTCADLFLQPLVLDACKTALLDFAEKTAADGVLCVIGLPLSVGGNLYNCAAVTRNGEILGIVPKIYLSNSNESYEKRWFTSGNCCNENSCEIDGKEIPFGKLLFRLREDTVMGIEIGEDLNIPIPPSSLMALKGANIILNPAAGSEQISKNEYRESTLRRQSASCCCAWVYSSSGWGESTTDLVFGGAAFITENGTVLSRGERFKKDGTALYACPDMSRINAQRLKNKSFADNASNFFLDDYTIIDCSLNKLKKEHIDRKFHPHPFVPSGKAERDRRCEEVLQIQAAGLEKRLSHTGSQKIILGISGGLDSTLALLVSLRAARNTGIIKENILCLTMPGFGTTDKTLQNARDLMDLLGVHSREIDIKPVCIQHMQDIGHDMNIHDVTYENVQARERTQILMDIANKEGALLVGTGNLSELALGWCTYNGDHMSMYGVNSSVPKTLIRHLVRYEAGKLDKKTAEVLEKILDTPVSPELLPPEKDGSIKQKTEENIGPYELSDFFLYYFLRFGAKPEKLTFMAKAAFEEKYSAKEIEKWLEMFIKRFFMSQFKRSCSPDGVKVGTVSLSPRGDWRMPSDVSAGLWLKTDEN